MFKTSILVLALANVPALADVMFLDASHRGWVSTGLPNNNGADPGNNYLAGELISSEFRNWFEFAIPDFSGTLASATLELVQPQPGGHVGNELLYSVYGLDSQPMVFSDITASTLYGAVGTDSGGNSTVSISLNAAALAAISGPDGGNFFIAGIDSGELGSDVYDFGGTDPRYRSILILTTVPEPHTLGLVVIGVLLSAGLVSRKSI